MRPTNHSRPSAGLLVAALALTLGFATTAVAGPDAANRAVSKSAAKQIAKKQIKKQAPGLSVAHADTAAIGQSPVAYAHVNANGTVDAANSRGVSNANVENSPNFLGVFCFEGLAGVSNAIVVPETVEPATPGLVNLNLQATHLCPGAQFTVGTFAVADSGAGAIGNADMPFSIWFFN